MYPGCFVPFVVNYSVAKYLPVGGVVSSDEFSAGGHLWTIDCYPSGVKKTAAVSGKYLSLFLRVKSAGSNGVKDMFEAFALTRGGEPSAGAAAQRTHFRVFRCNSGDEDWGWSRFAARQELEDRYAMDRLKQMCAERLLRSMTTESVADIMVCAETYNCPELKTKCVEFFVADKNFKKAVFTHGFAVLLQKFPVIAADIKMRVGR
ncbi:BTB/POZ and MATH domain-containing protein 6-like [Oryza brachyantha]|uniref:MATH domain-containing protein n=1 Tax=Oryza brachyantha TaxID=4533 RepID=J3MUJ7_ORYBR|nr:BTB/POZ and MATH domain-containing protein 6-like [Oryza brachyantha]